MQLRIPTLSKRAAVILFFAVVLLLNFLPVALFPLIAHLQKTGAAALPLLYYLIQLFDCLLPAVGIGCALVLFQRRGVKTGLIPLLFLAASKILASFLGTFLNESATLWYYNLASSLLQGLLYTLLYMAVAVCLYLIFIRRDRESEPAILGFQNPFFTANLLLAIFFFLYRTVVTILDVIVFIEENYYGLLSFIPTEEILSIVLDFIVVLLYSAASYFVIYCTERFALAYCQTEGPD